MTSFHAENCCHLVSEHEAGQFLIDIGRTFVLVVVEVLNSNLATGISHHIAVANLTKPSRTFGFVVDVSC